MKTKLQFRYISFFAFLLFGYIQSNAQFIGLTGEVYAISDEGTTYRVYAEFGSPNDQLLSVFHFGFPECLGMYSECADPDYPYMGIMPWALTSETSFYQHPFGANFGSEVIPSLFETFPALEYDSWLTIGSDSYEDYDILSLELSNELEDFSSGSGFVTEDNDEGMWYVVPNANPKAYAGEDLLVLIGQLTVVNSSEGMQGQFTLLCNLQWRSAGDAVGGNYELGVVFNSEDIGSIDLGCTDPDACNFSPAAVYDDGSCIPAGCMDSTACNYNASAGCLGEACDFSCCPGPGCCSDGMQWDYELQVCVFDQICSEDLTGDGVIGVNDLMQLLSSYGTTCP